MFQFGTLYIGTQCRLEEKDRGQIIYGLVEILK